MAIKAAIRALLSSYNASPIFSGVSVELPRIVYARTGADTTIHLEAATTSKQDTFNFSIIANRADEAETIAQAVKTIFEAVVNQEYFKRIIIRSMSDAYRVMDGKELPVYEIMISAEFFYNG